MPLKKNRIGLIGFGQIGSSLYEYLQKNPALEVDMVFIYESDPQTTLKIPPNLRLESMSEFATFAPNIIVEAAHPDAVRQYAEIILKHTNLMIMSTAAMVDAELEFRIRKTCQKHGTRFFIPHGAVLGLDGIRDGLSIWEEVIITMRKNLRNLDFNLVSGIKAEDIVAKTVLYDGPTRGVLPLYPKNVNSHATLALAALGLDRTRSVLIADPSIDESIIEIEAKGGDVTIHIERQSPIKGVTGKLTILSVIETLKRILGDKDVMQIV